MVKLVQLNELQSLDPPHCNIVIAEEAPIQG